MDKGAHFYRCDFQVHSPRDRAWTGRKFGVDAAAVAALTPEEKKHITDERIQFAKEYLIYRYEKYMLLFICTIYH